MSKRHGRTSAARASPSIRPERKRPVGPPPPPAIYALSVWSVKKVNGKWHISRAARFDEREAWSKPYDTLQRAMTAIARKHAEEVLARHKRRCEHYGIDD
jgi:hypothetical protein